MSSTTSAWKRARYSIASRIMRTAASGSSPLTWKTGAWTPLATSVQNSVLRESCGEVV